MMILFVYLIGLATAVPIPSPSASKLNYIQSGAFTMFQHFGPCTYANCQWNLAPAPASVFTPADNMDTDQWMEAAVLLGVNQVCLTVRHVDGFALWPTKSNNYSVASSPWRGGKGDVVKDFVASCRKYQIQPCFYIILGFNAFTNKTGVSGTEYMKQQKTVLTELLTQYGPIARLWWDNYALNGPAYQPITEPGFICPGNVIGPGCPAWQELIDLVRSLQPNTLIFPGPDGCLLNSESAGGTYPVYYAGQEGSYYCGSSQSTPNTNATNFLMAESDYSIMNPGDNWFWNPGLPFLDAGTLWSQYTLKHGQGASLILNVPPNSTGMVPDEILAVLASFHQSYQATYGNPIAAVSGPFQGVCAKLSVVVHLSPASTFDQLLLEEDLTDGQRINGYTLEVKNNATQTWSPLVPNPFHGRTIGFRVREWGLGDRTGIDAIRWNCTDTVDKIPTKTTVTLKFFGVYKGAPISERKLNL